MDTKRKRAAGLLLAALLLSIGTPAYLAWSRPGLGGYLLHPVLFAGQAAPYLLAAALWLPWRSPLATTITQALAGLLLLAAGVLYIPMLTGLVPVGGDMVGLLFVVISVVTTVSLLALSAGGYLLLRLLIAERGGDA